MSNSTPVQVIRGIGASPGIVTGPVFRYEVRKIVVERRQIEDGPAELARLEAALEQARHEVHALFEQAKQDVGDAEAAVFEAHEMFLSDPDLLLLVHTAIQEQHTDAAYAWQTGTGEYADQLRSIGDEYLAARAADIEDVAQRVLRILQGIGETRAKLLEPVVIVAPDLAPSDTMLFDKAKVLAFCTELGGPTSHVAILSKALGIPAITGLGEAVSQLRSGVHVIVDGNMGEILVNPDQQTLNRYQQQADRQAQSYQEARAAAHQPAVTLDGTRVEVVANIGSPENAKEALEYGAEGVGLLRTEFLFMEREAAPSEEEQLAVYQAILTTMGTRPVVTRTLDIGGDKPAPYIKVPEEMNPFLGVRGIRLTLQHSEVGQSQLRALLRAGVGHTLKIMFPMVATSEEVQAIRQQIQLAQETLTAQGLPFAQNCEIGIMVEVPSAAIMADALAGQVDFFSIGTNDLTQYTLAIDRTNAGVASMADALHPAVLRLIRMVIEAAHAQGKWVGVCGELAGDVLAVPVLLGLGLDEFSASHRLVPLIKQAIRRYSVAESRQIATMALSLPNAAQVRQYLRGVAHS
ncbi:MAG TPA: phosphoenolpyruvate--protein phosphotransferase [Ktedonosporobacter sp.]|nr:phosphoenolpyruvate--protein phosphotransferase [Ktedonosporobacter sp.]